MYVLHHLPGFYPSVEPRHDEAGNSRTGRLILLSGAGRNPSFTLPQLYGLVESVQLDTAGYY